MTFIFNRELHLNHFAKIEQRKENNKSDYYKRRNAGLKAYNTRIQNEKNRLLKSQLIERGKTILELSKKIYELEEKIFQLENK